MKKLILAGLLLLSACAGQGLQLAGTAGTLTPSLLSPQQVAQLAVTCQKAQAGLALATQVSNPKVSQTAAYPAAYCQQLLASGQLPPTTNAQTPSWLPQVLQDAQLAAQLAGVVLPLLI